MESHVALVGLVGAIAGALITGIPVVLQLLSDTDQNKRDFCFRLYELWVSEHMRKCRSDVIEYFDRHANNEAVDFVQLENDEDSKDVWRSLGSVEHFLVDLDHFLEQKVVHKRLARQIFSDQAKYWLRRLLNEKSKCTGSQAPLRPALTSLAKAWGV